MNIILLPTGDRDTGPWNWNEYDEAWEHICNGVDTPIEDYYIHTSGFDNFADAEFSIAAPDSTGEVVSVTVRALISSSEPEQEWNLEYYTQDDEFICGIFGANRDSGVLSATVSGSWAADYFTNAYVYITALYGDAEPTGEIYEIDVLLVVEEGETVVPDSPEIREDCRFRAEIGGTDVADITSISAQNRIEYKSTTGEEMPAPPGMVLPPWGDTYDPGDGGEVLTYSQTESKRRTFLTVTIAGHDQAGALAAEIGNDLTIYQTTQYIDGVAQDETAVFVAALETVTPHTGAGSKSLSLYCETESDFNSETWGPEERTITEGITYIAPNRQDGKYTFNMAGPVSCVTGDEITYDSTTFILGEYQLIVNSSGVNSYLKEY